MCSLNRNLKVHKINAFQDQVTSQHLVLHKLDPWAGLPDDIISSISSKVGTYQLISTCMFVDGRFWNLDRTWTSSGTDQDMDPEHAPAIDIR